VTGAAANQWYNSNLPKGKTVNFDGAIYLSNSASNRNMRFAGDGDYIVNGPIYNAEGDNNLLSNSQISKFGTGAVIINSTTLSYTGGTSITLGTVVFNRPGLLPPAVSNTGGPLYIAVNTNGAVGYAGGIQDPDFLSRLSNASIAGNSTGSLAIVTAADAATNVDFNAAADNWGGMGLGAANGAFTYSGVLTPRGQGWRLGGGNGTLTFSQALEDRNGALTNLTVLGGSRGVLILTNAGNTYTGSTEVRANGTLKNGVDNAIATSGNTTTVNGTYDLNGFNQSIRSLAGSGTLTSSLPNSILTIVPPGASTFGGSITGSLGIVLNGDGTVTLTGAATQTGPTAVNGGLLQYNNTTGSTFSVGTISGAGTAQVAVGNTVISDGVTVNTLQLEGTHTIRANGGAAGASRIPNLAVAQAAGTWTGKLDLTNNVLVVPNANAGAKAATISTLRDLVDSGRNGGTWDGTGITSSTVAANPAVTTLALVDNADLQLTTYRGLTGLDANSVLLVQARFGDASIDGTVDAFDLNIVAGHWQQASGAMWSSGDFNGDGMVDAFDLNILASNWQFGAGSLTAALAEFPQLGGIGAVPEPTSLALLLGGGLALLGRRRRRYGGGRGRNSEFRIQRGLCDDLEVVVGGGVALGFFLAGGAGAVEEGHAEFGHEGAVAVFAVVFLGEELVAGEDGVGAGEKAERLGLIGHFHAARRESDVGGGQDDAGGGDHADEFDGVDGGLVGERGAFDALKGVDGDGLGVGVLVGELLEEAAAIVEGFAHADDAAATDGNAGAADVFDGAEAVVVGAGGDDLAVEFGGGVEVVVVGVAAGGLEALGLGFGEHAEGAADFHAQGVDVFDKGDDGIEFFAIFDFPPGGAHAEAGGAFGSGLSGFFDDVVDGEDAVALDARVVVGGLGAVGAVFGAAAGFDGEEGGALDDGGVEVCAVDGLGLEEEFGEGEVVEGADFGEGPVMAECGGG
jgi:autotransporter-associated beta strand protein